MARDNYPTKDPHFPKDMFRCLNCRGSITGVALGTRHRNHCPVCLWSRHLDFKTPGDRKSPCRSKMKPIGLKFKNRKLNPFTGRASGELMIVHQCTNCGEVSANRIAGDDDPRQIAKLLEEPGGLTKDTLDRLRTSGLKLLAQRNKREVLTTLFGDDYPKTGNEKPFGVKQKKPTAAGFLA